MEYKIILGYLSVAVELIAYLLYFRGIFKGKTKPHAFTWLVWGVLNVVAFAAVLVSGGEAGAWVLGINALACFIISGVGFWQKIVKYDLYDWLALSGAFIGIFLWWLTKDPFYAILLVVLSDLIGSIPTFRKAYTYPFEENLAAFAFGMIYYPIAIIALESLTLTTWLYPAAVFLLDGALVVLIFFRRKNK